VLPQVINHAVRHGEHDVALLHGDAVQDCVLLRCIGAVGAELSGTVEPVPLRGRAEEDVCGGVLLSFGFFLFGV
jgi:hypothetical protein